MKRPLTVGLIAAIATGGLRADDLVVVGKNQLVVGVEQSSGAFPEDPRGQAFVNAFYRAVGAATPFETVLRLTSPPAWGKTVSPKAGGQLAHVSRFAGGLVAKLRLEHLAPHQRYILTLNGRPDLPGNASLPTPVPGLESERYYDFLFIRTDSQGVYQATLGVLLPADQYQVRLYVKDADDFKIVLYHDYFPFTVE